MNVCRVKQNQLCVMVLGWASFFVIEFYTHTKLTHFIKSCGLIYCFPAVTLALHTLFAFSL